MKATLEAPMLGAGTIKYTGTPNAVGGTTLKTLLGGTIPEDVSAFDLYIVSAAAAVYYENDGSAADADAMPLDAPGFALRVRNAKHPIDNDKFKFFCSGAVDFRFQLWK
jgi:hypothetical protein